jgi:hypothetical protein
MEEMQQAARAYLDLVVRVLSGDREVPIAVRNECHRLLVAIDGNDQKAIAESVARLEELAANAGIALPDR